MIKFLTTSSFILLFFATNLCYGGEVDKDLHNKCLYPTILISGKESYGTGVIIRSEKYKENIYKNAFISCGHLVDDKNINYDVRVFKYENWSQLKTTKVYPAFFYGANHDLDLAVGFFYSDEEMPIAKLNFDPELFIGNNVFRIGCGLGDDPRLDYGKITAIRKKELRTSIPTVPGDSGGPVFYENKVIAIMVTIKQHDTNLVFFISQAIPIKQFKNWDDNLDFIWDSTKPMPEMPFKYLNFRYGLEIKKK